SFSMNKRLLLAAAALVCLAPATLPAQIGVPERPLPDGPLVIDTAEQGAIRAVVMKGLDRPWDLAFLPSGDMLVTERPGKRLRRVRGGVLDPQPITGLPEIGGPSSGGLMSVAIHPGFAENGWVYLTYTKDAPSGRRAVGLARG